MKKEYIYKILIDRGYNAHTAHLVAEDLTHLHESLHDCLSGWLRDESDRKDFKVHNYSISQLQAERLMSYPAALLTIDWLIKEPEKATKSLMKKLK